MKHLLAVFGASALLLASSSFLQAGAKTGKSRWTFNPQRGGEAKVNQPLKVPKAKDDDTPGRVELRIVFKAQEIAEFVILGDGDTEIGLIVYDSRGKVVAQDVDSRRGSDLRICEWTPPTEQEYLIVLINHGRVYNMCQAGCN